jgi:hypothetical protein
MKTHYLAAGALSLALAACGYNDQNYNNATAYNDSAVYNDAGNYTTEGNYAEDVNAANYVANNEVSVNLPTDNAANTVSNNGY